MKGPLPSEHEWALPGGRTHETPHPPYQAGIAFTEELLPGLDIIPTATIAWLLENTELGRNFNSNAPPSGGSAWPPPGMGDPMKRAEGSVVDDQDGKR